VNKKSGLLCKVQDVNSLKKQIEFLIRHKDIRIKYGNFGAKLAKKNYDIKIIVNKNLEIYKKLIANYV
jgi:glycosyltransferase involved in cell wall biosynthesis